MFVCCQQFKTGGSGGQSGKKVRKETRKRERKTGRKDEGKKKMKRRISSLKMLCVNSASPIHNIPYFTYF